MFSSGLRCLAVAAGLVWSSVPVQAGPEAPDDGATPTPTRRMFATSAEHSELARMHGLIDRNQIHSMPELVDNLLGTIAKLSSYMKPSARPQIHKVSRAQIEHTVCRGPCPVKAWHVPGEGIFLDEALTPETNLVDRSVLLHELIHFLQEVDGASTSTDNCDGWLQREREAYELQNRYLSLVGNGPSYHVMVANQSWIIASRSSCGAAGRVNTAQ